MRSTASTPTCSPTLATIVSTADPGPFEHVGGAGGRRDREAELDEPAGRDEPGVLVAVGEREEHGALARQRVARAGLALGERHAERAVDAHDLAGRAHLGPEDRVDVGEAVERQHRLLHRDVAAFGRRAQQTFGAQLVERRADHHPRRDLRERNAGRLAHERHRATRARVRLDHEHLAVLHRVLHVEQADDFERVGERARVLLDRLHDLGRERGRRDRARGVAGVHAGFLDVLHAPPPITTSPVRSRSASTSTSTASSRKRSMSAGRSADSPPSRPSEPVCASSAIARRRSVSS